MIDDPVSASGSFPSFEPLTRKTLTVVSGDTNQQVSLDVSLGSEIHGPMLA